MSTKSKESAVSSTAAPCTATALVPPPSIQAAIANAIRQLPVPVNLQQITTQPTVQQPPVELPSFYNPKVVNAAKFAEQQQKRKLLWGAKKEEAVASNSSLWSSAKFTQDTDGVKASKFMRLMGIKDGKLELLID